MCGAPLAAAVAALIIWKSSHHLPPLCSSFILIYLHVWCYQLCISYLLCLPLVCLLQLSRSTPLSCISVLMVCNKPLITAFVPWFVNIKQLIVVWKSWMAGGRGLFLCLCVCTSARLSVCVIFDQIKYMSDWYKHLFLVISVCEDMSYFLWKQEAPSASILLSVLETILLSTVTDYRPKILPLKLQDKPMCLWQVTKFVCLFGKLKFKNILTTMF